MASPARPPSRRETRPRRLDQAAPSFKAVELAQRGRMYLDVASADLAAAEEVLGPFHETSWHFRRALAEARNGWDRLRARFGLPVLEAALEEPPATVLTLGRSEAGAGGAVPASVLIVIAGRTYRVEPIAGSAEAPRIYRLTHLPPNDDGPYFACRLADDSTQCDCAEWTYQIADLSDDYCKHLTALAALGWL